MTLKYVIPDLITEYHEIESASALTPQQKEEKRGVVQAEFEERLERELRTPRG